MALVHVPAGQGWEVLTGELTPLTSAGFILPTGWQRTPTGRPYALSAGHAPPPTAAIWGLVAMLEMQGVLAYPEIWIDPTEPNRAHRFRFDLAIPQADLLCEVQGGVWNGGKHGRGSGIVRDHRKANQAALWGWRCVYLVPDQVGSVAGAAIILAALVPATL